MMLYIKDQTNKLLGILLFIMREIQNLNNILVQVFCLYCF